MKKQEDSDIKIFTGKTTLPDIDEAVLCQAHEMQLHRENGNSKRARDLGVRCAEFAPNALSNELSSPYTDDAEVMYQIKILNLFTGEACMHMFIPHPCLAATAVNAMYDTLESDFPLFYTGMRGGAAFGFYYLALRRGVNIEKEIGEVFAMLCGDENSKELATLGTSIFTSVHDRLAKAVAEINFIDISDKLN